MMKRVLFFFLTLFLFCRSASAEFLSPSVFTLDNGMKFYVISHPKGTTLFHGLFYNVGSLDDPLGKEGLAHFFEHMMFKGPDGNLLYTLGGDENAYTTYHMTVYHQSFPREHLRSVLRREVRRMSKLPIDDNEFKSEQKVILEERLQSYDNNSAALFSEQARALFYFRHPYALPVIGFKETIQNVTKADMDVFFETYYVPQNAVSIVVGNIDPNEAFKIANATLGQVQKEGQPNRRAMPPESAFPSASVSLLKKDPKTHYPSLSLLMMGPSYATHSVREVAALSLLIDYLTDGVKSTLQGPMVYQKKTALGVSAGYSPGLPFGGMLSFSMTPAEGVSSDQLFEQFDTLLSKLEKDGIDSKTLQVHKKRILAGLVYLKDDPDTLLHALGSYIVAGLSVEQIEAIPDAYQFLTKQDLLKALSALRQAPRLKGERLPQ